MHDLQGAPGSEPEHTHEDSHDHDHEDGPAHAQDHPHEHGHSDDGRPRLAFVPRQSGGRGA